MYFRPDLGALLIRAEALIDSKRRFAKERPTMLCSQKSMTTVDTSATTTLVLRLDQLRQGDVLLTDSGTKPATLIKLANWGDFSHAAVVISPLELLESNDNGIRHCEFNLGISFLHRPLCIGFFTHQSVRVSVLWE
jgi:hypothetical protein